MPTAEMLKETTHCDLKWLVACGVHFLFLVAYLCRLALRTTLVRSWRVVLGQCLSSFSRPCGCLGWLPLRCSCFALLLHRFFADFAEAEEAAVKAAAAKAKGGKAAKARLLRDVRR